MSNETNASFEFDQTPDDYFNHLLTEKQELHETLLRKAVGEDVWARQREIEDFTLRSLTIDSKGFVDIAVAGIIADDIPDTPDHAERDNFTDVENALMTIERSYLDGFTIMTDDTTPYLVKRDNPRVFFEPVTLKSSVVRFIEFITADQDGNLQREWYRSVSQKLDFSLSLLARERQKAEATGDTELNRTPLEADTTTLLFTALENLNFKYCQMLETPRDQLLQILAQDSE